MGDDELKFTFTYIKHFLHELETCKCIVRVKGLAFFLYTKCKTMLIYILKQLQQCTRKCSCNDDIINLC